MQHQKHTVEIKLKGPSGSGKTLIINTIAPILQNDGYDIVVYDLENYKYLPANSNSRYRGKIILKTEKTKENDE